MWFMLVMVFAALLSPAKKPVQPPPDAKLPVCYVLPPQDADAVVTSWDYTCP